MKPVQTVTLLCGFALPLAALAGCAHDAPAPAPAKATVAELPPAAPPVESKVPRPTVSEHVPDRTTPDADFRQQRPQPGPEATFEIPQVKRFTLPNGLPVILATDTRLPLVQVQVVIKTGSLADPKGKAGLADLTANMMDEGTKKRSAIQISDDIEQLGASLGAEADWDASVVSVYGLSETIDAALEIWADVLVNPAFDARELDRVRENLLAGIKRRKDSPPYVSGEVFMRTLFGETHPLGWPQDGTDATLPVITVDDLKAFHARHFKPKNAVLVVAGNMTEADVKAKIGPLLKGWKGGTAWKPAVSKPAVPDKTSIYLVDKQGAPQSSIRIGLPALPRKHPDYYKAMVMNEILGGSFRRLTLNLREKRGWTYGVYSRFTPHRIPGPWQVAGEFVADKTADSVKEIQTEIETLRSNPVPDNELREAKDSLIKAFPARFATVRQIAGQMGGLAIFEIPEKELRNFPNIIKAVTVADVQAMARKYLLPEHLAIVVVGDRASNEKPLEALAPVQHRDVEGKVVAN
jgi:zinc protease